MPCCRLCNFSNDTGTPSEFQTDFHISNNAVKWYDKYKDFLCLECKIAIDVNSDIYKDELKKNDNNVTDSEESPAVPDVPEFRCLFDT